MADLKPGSFERLVVFGGISLDTMVRVKTLPQPDDKIFADHIGDFPGGMGANVAAIYSMLGGKAQVFGGVGNDESGQHCLEELASVGVDVTAVRRGRAATFRTVAMIDPAGEKAMLLIAGPNLPSLGELPELHLRPGRDAIHIAPGRWAPPVERVQAWRRSGVQTSIDIEPVMLERGLPVKEWLAAATIVFCGEKASRMIGDSDDRDRRYAALLSGGAAAAIITRGRHGAGLMVPDGQHIAVPGVVIKAVDTTGAGDAFAGAFLWGLSQAWPQADCLALANQIAGQAAGVFGSRLPLPRVREILSRFQAGVVADRSSGGSCPPGGSPVSIVRP